MFSSTFFLGTTNLLDQYFMVKKLAVMADRNDSLYIYFVEIIFLEVSNDLKIFLTKNMYFFPPRLPSVTTACQIDLPSVRCVYNYAIMI